MLSFLSKCLRTISIPVCHGNGNIYNFAIPTALNKPSKMSSFANTFRSENEITGARKNEKISGCAFDSNNGCIKGNNDYYTYLNSYQKCNFHSSSSLFSYKSTGYGEFQKPDKRKANIYIAIILSIVAAMVWGNYKIYMTTYDEPIKRAEKL